MRKLGILLIIISACSTSQQVKLSKTSTVITNVNLIDVRTGEIQESRFVVVDSGKITNILEDMGEIPEGIKKIDGFKKYLLPGLTEMHAHIPSPQWGRSNIEETLFLYLSNGVTTIRGMLGHPIHLELRAQAEKNEILSPRIFTASPSVNGNTVQTIESAQSKVKAYKDAGYDFLKIHPGLKLEVFNEVVKTANEVGIPYSGHVPVDVGIRHALASKYATIDHVDGFLEGLVPEEAGVDPSANGFFGFNFTDLADPKSIPELVNMSKEYGVWVVPTQSLFERWYSPLDADSTGSTDEMKYMPRSTVESWVNAKKQMIGEDDFSDEKWEIFISIRRQLISSIQENGQGLLLGSDAPQVFNVPGFSIHHEIQGMVQAGLTPLEVIQSGTLNPAKFFDMEGEFGEIVEGASADFLLLRSNPIEQLDALRDLTGVMVRGHWLDKASIDQRLEEIAQNASNQ